MIKTRNSIAVRGGRIVNGARKYNEGRAFAHLETANVGGSGQGGGSVSVSSVGSSGRANNDTLLLGFINDRNKRQMSLFYKDIYNYDAVGGSAVDLTSTLPFSDFSLTGCEEQQLEVFVSSIERLSMKTQHATMCANELVYGEFVASAIYDPSQKIFTNMIPYDLNTCSMQYQPLISDDPIIEVTPDDVLQDFLNSDNPEVVKRRRSLPQRMVETMRQGTFELDPLTTIYLSRVTLDRTEPTSYFRRLLPVYLLEKTLTRGTLVEAARRQRAALHVGIGTDTWTPLPSELQYATELFQKADMDPLGPILATRNGFSLSEFRQGGDFWKITDINDQTVQWKLRALNISESFLSGDVNFATAEVNLAVYLENLKAMRENFTQRVYYNRIFPVIAAANGFVDSDKKQSKGGIHFRVRDGSQYKLPKVHWHKPLEPQNDMQLIETLNLLAEKGVPIPLRVWAAAGGLSIEQIESELEDDIEQREFFMQYQQDLEQRLSKFEVDNDGDEYEYAKVHAARKHVAEEKERIKESATIIKPKSSNIIKRDYGALGDAFHVSSDGKRKAYSSVTQAAAKKRQDEILARAAKSLSDPNRLDAVTKLARRKGLIKPR